MIAALSKIKITSFAYFDIFGVIATILVIFDPLGPHLYFNYHWYNSYIVEIRIRPRPALICIVRPMHMHFPHEHIAKQVLVHGISVPYILTLGHKALAIN